MASSISWNYYDRWLTELGIITGGSDTDTVNVHLNTSSIPMSPSDGYGTYTEPSSSIGYAPIPWVASSDSAAGGSATIACTQAVWALEQPAGSHDTATVYGWWLADDTREYLLAGGSFSPALAVPPGPLVTFGVSPITLTLGDCSPSVASGGLLDGLFDAPVIPSASFTTAPAWPTGTWIGGQLGSSGSAFEPPGAPPLPQYAILQGTDTLGVLLAQVFSVAGDATVRLCLAAAQRTFGSTQSLNVQIDGGDVGVIVGSDLGISWAAWASDSFTLAAGTHTVTFTSLAAPPLDATMFLTMISLAPVF